MTYTCTQSLLLQQMSSSISDANGMLEALDAAMTYYKTSLTSTFSSYLSSDPEITEESVLKELIDSLGLSDICSTDSLVEELSNIADTSCADYIPGLSAAIDAMDDTLTLADSFVESISDYSNDYISSALSSVIGTSECSILSTINSTINSITSLGVSEFLETVDSLTNCYLDVFGYSLSIENLINSVDSFLSEFSFNDLGEFLIDSFMKGIGILTSNLINNINNLLNKITSLTGLLNTLLSGITSLSNRNIPNTPLPANYY